MIMILIVIKSEQEVIQMYISEVIAYITIGYFFVTLAVLYLLSRSTISVDKKGGESRKDIGIYKENEEYRKSA